MENLVNNSNIFAGAYKGKRVLVIGHTGFKGSWLSLWLLKLQAEVGGLSLYLPSTPCNFEAVGLKEKITHYEGDIRNIEEMKKTFSDFRPQIVFHLAAQPIVRLSYDEPKVTFDTNLGGTVNVLEAIRSSTSVQAGIIITSDKCYQNLERERPYREDDRLGGDDPYSASKACAEIACHAYIESYFEKNNSTKIATARAGNVIGGGDWGKDRILPDCVRALAANKPLLVRNPDAIRPWQHVLEPLSGYLWLGVCLFEKRKGIAGEAFNFGPDSKVIKPVHELVEVFLKFWGEGRWEHVTEGGKKKESSLLNLSSDKARSFLGWRSILNFEESVELTAGWYKNYYSKKDNIYDVSSSQIDCYLEKAKKEKAPWIK